MRFFLRIIASVFAVGVGLSVVLGQTNEAHALLGRLNSDSFYERERSRHRFETLLESEARDGVFQQLPPQSRIGLAKILEPMSSGPDRFELLDAFQTPIPFARCEVLVTDPRIDVITSQAALSGGKEIVGHFLANKNGEIFPPSRTTLGIAKNEWPIPFVLRIFHPDYGPAVMRWPTKRDNPLVFPVVPEGDIRFSKYAQGCVVDERGRPLGNVSVSVVGFNTWKGNSVELHLGANRAVALTDHHGRYRLALPKACFENLDPSDGVKSIDCELRRLHFVNQLSRNCALLDHEITFVKGQWHRVILEEVERAQKKGFEIEYHGKEVNQSRRLDSFRIEELERGAFLPPGWYKVRAKPRLNVPGRENPPKEKITLRYAHTELSLCQDEVITFRTLKQGSFMGRIIHGHSGAPLGPALAVGFSRMPIRSKDMAVIQKPMIQKSFAGFTDHDLHTLIETADEGVDNSLLERLNSMLNTVLFVTTINECGRIEIDPSMTDKPHQLLVLKPGFLPRVILPGRKLRGRTIDPYLGVHPLFPVARVNLVPVWDKELGLPETMAYTFHLRLPTRDKWPAWLSARDEANLKTGGDGPFSYSSGLLEVTNGEAIELFVPSDVDFKIWGNPYRQTIIKENQLIQLGLDHPPIRGLFHQKLSAGEKKEIHVSVQPNVSTKIRILAPDGTPIPDIGVSVVRGTPPRKTDRDGEVEFMVQRDEVCTAVIYLKVGSTMSGSGIRMRHTQRPFLITSENPKRIDVVLDYDEWNILNDGLMPTH